MPERALARDQRRFRRLIENLDHAVVWEFDDSRQCYTFVSRHCKLVFGFAAEEWLHDPQFFETHVHPDDLGRVREAINKLRQREVADVRFEHRCRCADGRMIWVQSGAHVEEQDGCLLIYGVTIDIDHLKEAEERERVARLRAERAAQARDEVLAVVAHDLRNPLSAVTYACEELEAAELPESLQRTTQRIRRSVKQMRRLINDLLDAASIRAGRLRIHSSDFDAGQLLEHICDDFAGEARARGVALLRENVHAAWVRADNRRISQALSNLVGNALKFTESGGKIILRMRTDATRVHFEVEDDGRGIAPENLDRVFDHAWQSDDSMYGSGMGLYIVRGIVDAHAGEIKVASAPKQGTVFSFWLPR
jgi:PAS domain S-box-containing protein